MYCTNCGAKLIDNAKFCTECGFPTARTRPAVEPVPQAAAQPAAAQAAFTPAAAPITPIPRRYRGRLVIAVLACFLFFLPTGIPAIVFAAKAIGRSNDGDAETAKRYAKRSTLFFVLSLVCNILWNLIGLILLVKKYG